MIFIVKSSAENLSPTGYLSGTERVAGGRVVQPSWTIFPGLDLRPRGRHANSLDGLSWRL